MTHPLGTGRLTKNEIEIVYIFSSTGVHKYYAQSDHPCNRHGDDDCIFVVAWLVSVVFC